MNCLFYLEFFSTQQIKKISQRLSLLRLDHEETFETKFSYYELKKDGKHTYDKLLKLDDSNKHKSTDLFLYEDHKSVLAEWAWSFSDNTLIEQDVSLKQVSNRSVVDRCKCEFDSDMLEILRANGNIPRQPAPRRLVLTHKQYSMGDFAFKIIDLDLNKYALVCYYLPIVCLPEHEEKVSLQPYFDRILEEIGIPDLTKASGGIGATTDEITKTIARNRKLLSDPQGKQPSKPDKDLRLTPNFRFDLLERLLLSERLKKEILTRNG